MDIYEEYIESVIQMADQAIDNCQLEEATKWFLIGLHEEPGSARLHYRIASHYQSSFQKYEEAERHYWFAIKFKPDYRYAYENLADLYLDRSDYEGLERLMHAALKTKSLNSTFVYGNFGKAAEAKGDYAKALRCYRKGIMQSLDTYDVDDLKDHIKRIKYKRFKKRWKIWKRE